MVKNRSILLLSPTLLLHSRLHSHNSTRTRKKRRTKQEIKEEEVKEEEDGMTDDKVHVYQWC